ncbi:class I SAM-dependent methyltransferase [Chlamydiota bacterium]
MPTSKNKFLKPIKEAREKFMTLLSFKEFEHQAWLKAVDQYDISFSRLTQQTIPAILNELDIRKGVSMLDVACGPGYLAAAAHHKGAIVNGVDFSSAMIARARQHHPHIDFSEGDAEDLKKYSDEHFDAVGMNFGIIHLGQPENALKAAYRVLKVGGRLAFTAWCKPQEAVGFLFVRQAVEKFGNPNVELPLALPLFFFSEPENCKNVLTQCGFANPHIQVINQTWELHSLDELFEAFLKGTARTAGLLKGQSAEQQKAIREAICNSLKDYTSHGKITIPMPALVASGTKI